MEQLSVGGGDAEQEVLEGSNHGAVMWLVRVALRRISWLDRQVGSVAMLSQLLWLWFVVLENIPRDSSSPAPLHLGRRRELARRRRRVAHRRESVKWSVQVWRARSELRLERRPLVLGRRCRRPAQKLVAGSPKEPDRGPENRADRPLRRILAPHPPVQEDGPVGMVAPALFHPLEGRSAPRLDPRAIPVPQGRGAAPKTASKPVYLIGEFGHVDCGSFHL